ncbi:hypothetical protein [Streptomyces sp. NPDC093544]|uniref:hypothetical protein n=1 Tax=Streptomyces sp. NPDC093544 TaxID=3155200 RepID=UPI00342E8B85
MAAPFEPPKAIPVPRRVLMVLALDALLTVAAIVFLVSLMWTELNVLRVILLAFVVIMGVAMALVKAWALWSRARRGQPLNLLATGAFGAGSLALSLLVWFLLGE